MAESSNIEAGEGCAQLRDSAILCADDNVFMRRMICTILRQAGARSIAEVADGTDLVRHLRHNRPDLILLDWHMRELKGPLALKIIQKSEKLLKTRVPVLVLTGSPNAEMVRKAALLGAAGVLSKPISRKLLLDKVTAMLAAGPEQRERVYI